MEVCEENIIVLLDDEDEQVRQHIDHIFYSLRSEHLVLLRDFIEAYASSKRHSERQFAVYLWEHGLLDPEWTLSIVDTVIAKDLQPSQRWWGTEELIRLVLRIYTDPTVDDSLKEQAMDIFDALMQKHPWQAREVLTEWDRR
jgi:hypothetical protein